MIKISSRMRLTLISQLCLGLICFLWMFSYPFIGKWYELQNELLLIESVMGSLETLRMISPEKAEALEKKAELKKSLYTLLSEEDQAWIAYEAHVRKLELQKTIGIKALDALFFISDTPLAILCWIILSILLPILLLLRISKTFYYIWLIPTLSLIFAWQNYHEGKSYFDLSDLQLFPKEKTLLTLFPQASLKEAWENFLIIYWADENISSDKAIKEEQLIKGEFYFSKARLNYLQDPAKSIIFQKSIYLLGLCILWNFLFTWSVYREKKLFSYCSS